MKPFSTFLGVGGFEFSQHERQYLNRVMDSQILSYGPACVEFEQRFAKGHQSQHAVVCNSGTSALHMAVAALKEKRGWTKETEIILPALTFVATLNMIMEEDIKPVFVDIDPKTYNIDPRSIEAAITPNTGAIMVVHLFGQPCEMDLISQIAKKHSLEIIEDSAETMFASFDGKSVGSFGAVGCFSTYMAHILTTGVGGLCTAQTDEMAGLLRSIMNHGRDPVYISPNVEMKHGGISRREMIQRRFKFVRQGYSYRMTEMEAALGLGQLDRMDDMIAKRRWNANFLISGLQKWQEKIQLPYVHPKAEHSYMVFPVVLRDKKISKWDLMLHLETLNIETREMVPLTNQPCYKNLIEFPHTPHTDWVNESGFYIGCHSFMDVAALRHIIAAFDEFFENIK